ncbi:zinc finger, CCHC-type, retrotransposon gag domain protein [Tanacetum coccineum]
MIKLALMVEKENNRQLEEGGDNKRKRENRDDDVKKIKTNSGKMENVGHTSKECKVEWVCFKCKSPGHKIVDCPERKLHDTQQGKTMERVFQLTAKNA